VENDEVEEVLECTQVLGGVLDGVKHRELVKCSEGGSKCDGEVEERALGGVGVEGEEVKCSEDKSIAIQNDVGEGDLRYVEDGNIGNGYSVSIL